MWFNGSISLIDRFLLAFIIVLYYQVYSKLIQVDYQSGSAPTALRFYRIDILVWWFLLASFSPTAIFFRYLYNNNNNSMAWNLKEEATKLEKQLENACFKEKLSAGELIADDVDSKNQKKIPFVYRMSSSWQILRNCPTRRDKSSQCLPIQLSRLR